MAKFITAQEAAALIPDNATVGNLVLDCFFDSLDMAELKSSVQSMFADSSNPPLLDLKTV